MMNQDKEKKSDAEHKDPPPESDKNQTNKKDEPSKNKPWKLAPRTGQRHANPFQRKTD